MGDYQHIIESFTFVTGSGGIFDLWVDGKLLFSKKAVGRHAELGEALALFRKHIPPGTPVYPREG